MPKRTDPSLPKRSEPRRHEAPVHPPEQLDVHPCDGGNIHLAIDGHEWALTPGDALILTRHIGLAVDCALLDSVDTAGPRAWE